MRKTDLMGDLEPIDKFGLLYTLYGYDRGRFETWYHLIFREWEL